MTGEADAEVRVREGSASAQQQALIASGQPEQAIVKLRAQISRQDYLHLPSTWPPGFGSSRRGEAADVIELSRFGRSKTGQTHHVQLSCPS